MKQRINSLLNSEGISAAKFADNIGVQRSSVSHVLTGRSNPSYDFMVKIIEAYPNVNLEWLMTGKGDMYKRNQINNLFEQEEKVVTKPILKQEKKEILEEVKPIIEDEPKELPRSNSSVFNAISNSEKKIEKIVVFFTDKTFTEYTSA